MTGLRRLSKQLVEAALIEAEADCENHTHKVTIYWDSTTQIVHKPKIVAGMMRVIADHTDGFCSVRNADDKDLTSPDGMAFHFTSEKKKTAFLNRLTRYLDADVLSALSYIA